MELGEMDTAVEEMGMGVVATVVVMAAAEEASLVVAMVQAKGPKLCRPRSR